MRFLAFSVMVFHGVLTGCAALSYGTYSSVEGLDDVVLERPTRYWAGVLGTDSIDFADFTLSIKPLNEQTYVNTFFGLYILPFLILPGGTNESERYSEHEQQDLFLVTLWLEPKGQELSFNPFGVILRTSNKDGIKPTGFWGATPNYEGCYGYINNKLKRPPEVFNKGLVPKTLGTRNCFTLLFEIKPPSPANPFVLDIIGLSKGAQTISVRPITFVKHSGWDYSTALLQ